MLEKNKISKKNGIILYEIVISILIISLFLYSVQLNYKKIKENSEIAESNIKIIRTFSKYRDLSYYERKNYNIEMNLIKKEIKFKHGLTILETIYLPKNLRYKIPREDLKTDVLNTSMNYNGNLSHAFSIYTFGESDIAKYRITFYTFSQLKYLTINLYKNIDAKEAEYKKIYDYNVSNNAKNHIGWRKE